VYFHADDWKIAKVKPLHKGDAKDLLNNYRPISVRSKCCEQNL
jgi:hypothetical protein